jgi:hypothetical protein
LLPASNGFIQHQKMADTSRKPKFGHGEGAAGGRFSVPMEV